MGWLYEFDSPAWCFEVKIIGFWDLDWCRNMAKQYLSCAYQRTAEIAKEAITEIDPSGNFHTMILTLVNNT